MVGPSLTTMHYVGTCGFVGDVLTSCLPIIVQAKATPVGYILKVTQQGAAPGAKSEVYNCLVLCDNVATQPRCANYI